MFKFDLDLIPVAVDLYKQLGVVHDPLTLIPPQFECPLPKLGIATFPPAMREPAAPALDQFDLDEHFAKEGIRLAQLTNKCASGEEDLEYYIAETGEILGVVHSLPYGERSAKHILYHIFKQIVDFKKQDFGKEENFIANGYNKVAINPNSEEFSLNNVKDGSPSDRKVDNSSMNNLSRTTHLAHIDLAPMNLDTNRANLLVRNG